MNPPRGLGQPSQRPFSFRQPSVPRHGKRSSECFHALTFTDGALPASAIFLEAALLARGATILVQLSDATRRARHHNPRIFSSKKAATAHPAIRAEAVLRVHQLWIVGGRAKMCVSEFKKARSFCALPPSARQGADGPSFGPTPPPIVSLPGLDAFHSPAQENHRTRLGRFIIWGNMSERASLEYHNFAIGLHSIPASSSRPGYWGSAPDEAVGRQGFEGPADAMTRNAVLEPEQPTRTSNNVTQEETISISCHMGLHGPPGPCRDGFTTPVPGGIAQVAKRGTHGLRSCGGSQRHVNRREMESKAHFWSSKRANKLFSQCAGRENSESGK